jgi:hypothetical protein
VISFRQPVGASNEILLALVGSFDAAALAKAFHDSPSRGDSEIVPISSNLLIAGKPILLAEAKLAAERGLLVDAPVMLSALSGLDTTRPVFGSFFPTVTARASARGSERAKQVDVEFDASKELRLKINFLFDTPKEAEDSKIELTDGLKQISPMVSVLGVSDASALLKAFVIKTDGNQLSFLLSLDEATAVLIIEGVARFTK